MLGLPPPRTVTLVAIAGRRRSAVSVAKIFGSNSGSSYIAPVASIGLVMLAKSGAMARRRSLVAGSNCANGTSASSSASDATAAPPPLPDSTITSSAMSVSRGAMAKSSMASTNSSKLRACTTPQRRRNAASTSLLPASAPVWERIITCPAALVEQQRFFLFVRLEGRGRKLLWILQRLDDDGDDFDVGIVDEIVDEIIDRGAELIAARDEIGKAELAFRHQRRERGSAEPAALRHDGDRARPQRPRDRPAERRNAVFDIDEAEAVRPADAQAFGGQRFQAQRARFADAAFAEAGGQNDGARNAFAVRLLEHVAGGFGAHGGDDAIDTGRQVADARIAGKAVDLPVARVDAVDRAGEPIVAQIGDDVGAAAAALRGADHRDRARRQQWCQGTRIHWQRSALRLQPELKAPLHRGEVLRPPGKIDHVGELLVGRIGRHQLGDRRLDQVEGLRILRAVVDQPREHRLVLGAADDVEKLHAAVRIGAADRHHPGLIAAFADRLVPHQREWRMMIEDRLGGAPVHHGDDVDFLLLHQLLAQRIVRPPGFYVRLDALEAAEGTFEIERIEFAVLDAVGLERRFDGPQRVGAQRAAAGKFLDVPEIGP